MLTTNCFRTATSTSTTEPITIGRGLAPTTPTSPSVKAPAGRPYRSIEWSTTILRGRTSLSLPRDKTSRPKNNPDTTEGWRPVVDSYKATAWDKGSMESSYQIRLNDERIKGGNSYLHFSGGDRALLKIETSHTSGRKILIVKDSFGNAFVPYLANHYDEIYVVDPRYYVRSIKTLVKENGITDVLILNYMFGTSNATWLKGFDAIAK